MLLACLVAGWVGGSSNDSLACLRVGSLACLLCLLCLLARFSLVNSLFGFWLLAVRGLLGLMRWRARLLSRLTLDRDLAVCA